MTLLALRGQAAEINSIYDNIENLEDRRKLKKKFDNVVAEIKNRVLNEDPVLRGRIQEELRSKRQKKKCWKRRLTFGAKYTDDYEECLPVRSRSVGKVEEPRCARGALNPQGKLRNEVKLEFDSLIGPVASASTKGAGKHG